MDARPLDEASRGPCLLEYDWVAGPWRRVLLGMLVFLAAGIGFEVLRALESVDGSHSMARPIRHSLSFLLGLGCYLSRTRYHLNALQLSWRTTPIPLFADGAISRSELAGFRVSRIPGVPDFLSPRGSSLLAVLRSGEERLLLHYAGREQAQEVGQYLADELGKPGPA